MRVSPGGAALKSLLEVPAVPEGREDLELGVDIQNPEEQAEDKWKGSPVWKLVRGRNREGT